MIEIQLLRYALAAADTGSFSRAAYQFGVKQSTLSRHVHYLEDRLGLALFRRSARGVVATRSGECFLGRARRIVRDIDQLNEECRALAGGRAGTISLGFHGSLASGDLSAVLRDFREAFPDVEIAARERSRAALLRDLERGHLDLAICAGQAGAGLRSLTLWHEPLHAMLVADDPLLERDRLYWTDLRDRTFVISGRDPGPEIGNMVVARLSGPGYRPRFVVQQVGQDNLPALAGSGRVVLTAGPTPAWPTGEGRATRPVHDAFGATQLEQAVHWRKGNENPALRRFLELLGRRYGRYISIGS